MTDQNHNFIEPLEPMFKRKFSSLGLTNERHFNVFVTLQDNRYFVRLDKNNKDIEELTESIKLAKHAIDTSSFCLRTVTSKGEFTSNSNEVTTGAPSRLRLIPG